VLVPDAGSGRRPAAAVATPGGDGAAVLVWAPGAVTVHCATAIASATDGLAVLGDPCGPTFVARDAEGTEVARASLPRPDADAVSQVASAPLR
jgi:hypothetical protein